MAAPFTFVNYDRITDNLIWLGYTGNKESVQLKFVVDLVKQDMYGNEKHFHMENKFYSKKFERYSHSINRTYSFYYVINAGFENMGCILRASDVYVMNLLIDNRIIPWFMGDTRIFSMEHDRMILVGNYTDVTLPLNDRSYIKFSPVIINYENSNSFKEGVRMELNGKDTCVDITLDKFMEFVYILKTTSMANLAASMINYVKIPPYNINERSGSGEGPKNNFGGKVGNFFDK